MNEFELKIKKSLDEKIPTLNKERLERLGLIMEVAAMVLEKHDEVITERPRTADCSWCEAHTRAEHI